MAIYYNVKGISAGGVSNTTELVSPDGPISVSTLNVANVHASADATVTLFIQNDPESGTTNTYNIIKEVSIPAKTSLLFDNKEMFNYRGDYGLYIEVAASDTVDVMISKK